MKKQRHVWIVTDKDGNTGHNVAKNFYTEAFFSRSDARWEANRSGGRCIKYVPENKALVDAAQEALRALRTLHKLFDLVEDEKEAIFALEKALEAK